jgi:glycolate oxidase subunit GlcD
MHDTTTAIEIIIQPGALLATAPATTPVAQLNAALAAHGLCLPIDPLTPDATLAELVAANAGGRRRLRHGPIGRSIRAAVIDPGTGAAPFTIGGPTLKRATGYALNRAIAGAAVNLGNLRELTVSVRPLPAARAALLVKGLALPAAVVYAQTLLRQGLALSALPIDLCDPAAVVMLVELEGMPAVVERHVQQAIAALPTPAVTWDRVESGVWSHWETLALTHTAPGAATLDLTMPRAAFAALVTQIHHIAARYHFSAHLWGDIGVGALHLRLAAPNAAALTPSQHAEALQAISIISALARQHGGSLSTEFGGGGTRGHGDTGTGWHGGTMTPDGNNEFSTLLVPPTPCPPHPLSPSSLVPHSPLLALTAIVGENYLLTRPEDIATYNLDASIALPTGAPLAVALPATTEEVAALLRVAAEHGLPVVSRGAGSGLAGGSTPSAGALVLALNRLEQITIDADQMVAHVGAGAVTVEIQRAAEAVGLFYPPDPSSQTASTIGGNIACNAGGPRCVKYGVTADYVLALTAVLANGTVVRWGDGLAGQGPENGLAQLLVGSEGTLAVITAATLRLLPLPPARRTIMAIFPTLDAACTTVEQIMAAGIVPAGLELMEDATIAAVEAFLQIGLPTDAGAMLLMLADGEPEAVDAESAALAELARQGGATRVEVARTAADEANLWRARRAVSIALTRVRPNRLGEDISVPLPQIAACVRAVKVAAAKHNLPIVVYGHAGDGNLHPNILFDANDPAETARLWPCAEDVFRAALAVGGTLSGEHGVGTLKRPFMVEALGEATIAAMRAVKQQLDPDNRLNPGKVLPPAT